MNTLSLCSGIGGLDLAMKSVFDDSRTVAYVEIDPFCQAVLCLRQEDGWLDRAPIWPDLRTFDGTRWRGLVDGIVSGFPCQPFSVAGKCRGAEDERNLWPDVRRVIGESDPAVVILENVPGALPYFFHVVLPELQDMGYRTQAGLFRASDVGAPHRRERIFIVAHTSERSRKQGISQPNQWAISRSNGEGMGHASELDGRAGIGRAKTGVGSDGERRRGLGDGDSIPSWPPGPTELDRWAGILARWPELAPALEYPKRSGRDGRPSPKREEREEGRKSDSEQESKRDGVPDAPQSALRVLADELSLGLDRTARLRALGNAIVPAQAAYAIRELTSV